MGKLLSGHMAIQAAALAAVVGFSGHLANARPIVESEPNETKITADAGGMTPNIIDTITGTSTGTAATAGITSRDLFLVTPVAAPLGIYRNRLTLTTDGPVGHGGAIMGVPQSGAASDTTTVQLSSTTSVPPRMNQWYSFGTAHSFYYRVTGAAATTSGYTSTYTQDVVSPVSLAAQPAGLTTITNVGQTTTDTEMYLYDSAFNIVVQNDDDSISVTAQARVDAVLAAGTYYVAISSFNTANSLANGPPDTGFGNRTDFPNLLVRDSTTIALPDLDFLINGSPVTASAGAGDIYWATFQVPEPASLSLLGLGALGMLRRRRS